MTYIAEYYLMRNKTIRQSVITADSLDEAIDKAQERAGMTVALVNVELADGMSHLA